MALTETPLRGTGPASQRKWCEQHGNPQLHDYRMNAMAGTANSCFDPHAA
jgi:hypothetical protein